MSRYKGGLIVVIALLTIVGMTAVFAAPTGATLTSGDGMTASFDSVPGTTADSGENDSDDHPSCDNPGEADNNSANCTEKEEDDEEDEEDEEEDEDEQDEEEGEGAAGTCETGGAAQNNTVANAAFGTENESGPISSQIHANEGQFQDAQPVVHEASCVVATVDNNAAGNNSDDGGDGNQSNPAQDVIDAIEDNAPGNGTDDGDEGDGETGTCETGGAAQNNTLANEAFGTENEDGPISSQIHDNESQFQDAEPVAHEVSCGVATVDNNAP